jgi:hypothetical protein
MEHKLPIDLEQIIDALALNYKGLEKQNW